MQIVKRIFLSPPGRWMHIASAAAMIGALDASSVPGSFGYTELTIIFSLLWLLLIFIWVVRLIGCLVAKVSVWRWGWVVMPAIGAMVVALGWVEAPLYARFAVSQKDLNRLARNALVAGPKTPSINWGSGTPVRAGLYDVIVWEVTPSGKVYFVVPGTYFMRSCGGFIYSPGDVPDDPEGNVDPLWGPWYEWRHTW